MEFFAAIDPGVGGAIAYLDDSGSLITCYDMPTHKVGSKNLVDGKALRELLKSASYAVVEQVGSSPQMGKSSAFNFGEGFGMIRGVLIGMEIPFETIRPQAWKALVGLSGKEKKAALVKVREMFPSHAEITFKRVKDLDRADAALIGVAYLKLLESRRR